MKTIVKKPHSFFWISVPILILGGIAHSDCFYDFSLGTHMVSIGGIDLAIFSAIIFELIGIGYWYMLRTNKKFSRVISLLHITLSSVGICLFFICSVCAFTNLILLHFFVSVILFVILITQLLFAINVLWSLRHHAVARSYPH